MTPPRSLPYRALDEALLARALPLLDDAWLAHDAALAPVLPTVLARAVGQDWHKAGTFAHHLGGVARALTLWQQSDDVRLLGLLHSVYGNAFVNLAKFDAASERQRLQDLVGQRAEQWVYRFCTISRTQLVRKLLAGDIAADGSVVVDSHSHNGPQHCLDALEVAAFTIVGLADVMEQWYGWQEDIYAHFPDIDTGRAQSVHWAASLWPGPMRPSSRMLSQLSGLAAALRHPALCRQLPLPPIFDDCTHQLAPDSEAAASALYWSVVQLQHPLLDADAAIATLEAAVRLNPWVGEPQMLLAQLYLSVQRNSDAALAAASALQHMCAWGNAWDKRIAWQAQIAWVRILRQAAHDGAWPQQLARLNNMALDANSV